MQYDNTNDHKSYVLMLGNPCCFTEHLLAQLTLAMPIFSQLLASYNANWENMAMIVVPGLQRSIKILVACHIADTKFVYALYRMLILVATS